ncbi:SAM-dependent methyltransferase [Pseudomonas chlororaphis]|uniref:SAM-dependent methyltransferase n=1 Tax=Pseudomonas chlororaphis TaxID=587753 RepID=UPI0020A0620B|nr:methyltransferase domain-containing protein [Pseudomonas chlororaphis]
MARHDNSAIVTPYQESIAEYWNNEKSPINSLLGSLDNLYHHHYGLGDIGDGFFSGNKSEDEIIKKLHRLESAQAIFLLKHLGPLLKNDHILDAGSGRGGTSFMAYDQFECYVTGITISEKQVEFSQAKATQRNIQEKVSFHLRNMLDNGVPDSFFQAVLNNKSTMYVNLDKLFSEHARVLKTGGRFVCITGCYDDSNYGFPSRSVSKINSHYI